MSTDSPHAVRERKSDRLPRWFKVRLTTTGTFAVVSKTIREQKLHTVCASAVCPNQHECWNSGTATFLILGDLCTRGCKFCAVPKGTPAGFDDEEPERVARAVAALKLRYAVVTSVTRDDLKDGGAGQFAQTIRAIRAAAPECRVEVLIPDLQGSEEALRTVLAASPDVLNHNLETVPRLYPLVRPQADYQRSLELLVRARQYGSTTKTGLMLGLGEEREEISRVVQQLKQIDCDTLTLGQYLQAGKNNLPVSKYYHPEEFSEIREEALSIGLRRVLAGPLVRSSYRAGEFGSMINKKI